MKPPKVQLISLAFADGTVGIMHFIVQQYHARSDVVLWERLLTAENVEAEIARSGFAQPVDAWRFIELEDIPADRAFRNAWVDDGKGISHNMAKAREILRDKLRAERAPVLEALDVDYMRADERKDEATKELIAANKERLRDITNDRRIDAATSVEELKALTLEAM